jgi:hypothetical protein
MNSNSNAMNSMNGAQGCDSVGTSFEMSFSFGQSNVVMLSTDVANSPVKVADSSRRMWQKYRKSRLRQFARQ